MEDRNNPQFLIRVNWQEIKNSKKKRKKSK